MKAKEKAQYLMIRVNSIDKALIARMMKDDFIDRYGSWVKRMIRQEYDKRYNQTLVTK